MRKKDGVKINRSVCESCDDKVCSIRRLVEGMVRKKRGKVHLVPEWCKFYLEHILKDEESHPD